MLVYRSIRNFLLYTSLLSRKQSLWHLYRFSNNKDPTQKSSYLMKKHIQLTQIIIKQQQYLKWKQEQDRNRQEQHRKRQEQHRARQEQQRKSKQEKNRKFFIQNLLTAVFTSLTIGILSLYLSQRAAKKIFQEQNKMEEVLNKIQKFYFDEGSYVNSPIYKPLLQIIDNCQISKIKLIAGCSGIGKSTAIKKILKEKQKKGEIAFYFQFGNDNQTTQEKQCLKKQFYQVIKYLKTFKGDKQRIKKIKVVFDDINQLQAGNPQAFKWIMQDLYSFASNQFIDIICVSNTGLFLNNQKYGSFWSGCFAKAGNSIIIQQNQSMKSFHFQLVKKELGVLQNVGKNRKIEDYSIAAVISEMNLTTRKVSELTSLILSQAIKDQFILNDHGKLMQKIENILEDESIQLQGKVLSSKPEKLNRDIFKQLLKQINLQQSTQDLKLSNCSYISNRFDTDLYTLIKQAIQNLENNNLIVFCRPLSSLQSSAIKICLDRLEVEKNTSK